MEERAKLVEKYTKYKSPQLKMLFNQKNIKELNKEVIAEILTERGETTDMAKPKTTRAKKQPAGSGSTKKAPAEKKERKPREKKAPKPSMQPGIDFEYKLGQKVEFPVGRNRLEPEVATGEIIKGMVRKDGVKRYQLLTPDGKVHSKRENTLIKFSKRDEKPAPKKAAAKKPAEKKAPVKKAAPKKAAAKK